MRGLVLLGAVSGVLSGCASLGGNISGSFSCDAPDGICAPSAVIDDRALAMITGDAVAPGGATVPAGPYREAPEARPAYRTAAAVAPARTRERVLRIVFQPYIDEQGRLHEKSAVHAVVERTDWQPQVLGEAAAAPTTHAASVMPRLQAETLAEAVDRVELARVAAPAPNLSPPDPAKVAAARERGRDPVAEIKADVAARLKTPAGSPTPVPAEPERPRVSAGAGLAATAAPAPSGPASSAAAPSAAAVATAAPRATVRAGSFPAAVVGED